VEEVIVIVGPTCSGKTQLSLVLAEILNTEIISADSRQIYKKLNIGTAKPADKDLKRIKHYFIDELDPKDEFDANKFEQRSEKIIKGIHLKEKIPIVVGGSGLYIKALIDGISDSADTNEELRSELLDLRKKYGNEYLYKELEKLDPDSALKMLPQNWKRVLRALEVIKLTGRPIWQHQNQQKSKVEYKFHQFGLLWDRKTLYQNIEQRVDEMFESGLVTEIERILSEGYSMDLNSLNTVGYKEVIQFLQGEITLVRAIDLIKRNSRRYAKRQMTWFKKDKRITWYQINQPSDINYVCDQIIKMCKHNFN
jgi:tRNA dimethylallyltransferase